MYSLDIETLISVLQNRRIQGFLEADLATGGAQGSLRNGAVKVELRDGKIISISITDVNGRVLYQGQEALNRVRRLVLTWQLTETLSRSGEKEIYPDIALQDQRSSVPNRPEPFTNPSLPPVERSLAFNTVVPVRSRNLSPERLRYLSRTARSVYALVNGANSVQRIAGLLSLPVDVAYRELLALQEGQFVILRSDPYAQ